MSYTSYKYSNLKVSQSDFRHGDIIKVSVDVIFAVSGDGVYGVLKYESGVHRVQRVPATETQGSGL